MSSNYIASLISMSRGVRSIKNGDKVAIVTTLGHATKVIEKAANIDSSWGHAASSIVDGFSRVAEHNPALKILGKGLKIAKKGDEIGMVVSAVNAINSKTPARKFIEDGFGWGLKFLSKAMVLKYGSKICDIKGIKPIADKITNFSKTTKGFGQLNNIIAGSVYSVATIYGQKFGKKVGKFVADKLDLPIDQKPEISSKPKPIPLR